MRRQRKLPEIAEALRTSGCILRGGKRRQEQPDQQGNNANHDQEFNEGETTP
jgi:hypothetical protein